MRFLWLPISFLFQPTNTEGGIPPVSFLHSLNTRDSPPQTVCLMSETLSLCIPIEVDSMFKIPSNIRFHTQVKTLSPGIHPVPTATESLTGATELGRITSPKPLVAD